MTTIVRRCIASTTVLGNLTLLAMLAVSSAIFGGQF